MNYDLFITKYGIRRMGQFVTPKFIPLEKIVMFRDAILHYVPATEGELCIDQITFLLLIPQRLIMVNHHL